MGTTDGENKKDLNDLTVPYPASPESPLLSLFIRLLLVRSQIFSIFSFLPLLMFFLDSKQPIVESTG